MSVLRKAVIASRRRRRSNLKEIASGFALAMTRSWCILFVSILFYTPAIAEEEWKELKSEHFIVYYLEDENFAQEVSRWAEKYYNNIASDLGYSRYDNFWTWDNRAKIYIYRDRDEFLKATSARSWSYGFTIYGRKMIVSYARSPNFMKALLPHELAHLVFRDFVGFKGEVPMWIDEGVAQWEEADKRSAAVDLVKSFIVKGEIIPLSRLTQMDISQESSAEVSNQFYAEAVTLVGFLIQKYGTERFTLFCRSLRDGSSINSALSSAYLDSVPNMDALEKEWIKYYGG